jgi:hypothetical protein
MRLRCGSFRGWLRTAMVFGLIGCHADRHARDAHAQTVGKPDESDAEACVVRDVRSRHFLVHTDISSREGCDFVERLEALLGHLSTYWNQPVRGVLECYVIRNLDKFPMATIASAGSHGVRTAGGITLMDMGKEGKRQVAKSVVYASARLEVVQHELVHAYCYQTFSRIGPVWYSEGMAEIGHFWKGKDTAVHADSREIEFLRNNPPQSLAEPLSPGQVTGDGWRNYASRWSLCHFLDSNPNYSQQFRQLGRGLLAGKDVSFEQTYAATTQQLFFEYLFFLEHISQGYRVDLCAWNWKKKFTSLQPGQTQSVIIAAGRGWQPTGLTVRSAAQYKYVSAGTWQIAGQSEVDTDGDDRGRGRLVGVLMKDYQLGPEFELGAKGPIQFEGDGDLYLRCRNTWNKLAGDRGRVTVMFQHEGRRPSVCRACAATDGDPQTERPIGPIGRLTTCRATPFVEQ